MKFGDIFKKYGRKGILLPFRDCWFCESADDCPHPSTDVEGHTLPPIECVRKKEIILKKK